MLYLALQQPHQLCGLHKAQVRVHVTKSNQPVGLVLQEKGAGAPAGDNYVNPGEVPKPGKDGKGARGFSTSAKSWADGDTAKGTDSDSPVGNAKGSYT